MLSCSILLISNLSTPIREFKKAVNRGLFMSKAHTLVFVRSPITADILKSLHTVTAPKHTSTPLAYSAATVVLPVYVVVQ